MADSKRRRPTRTTGSTFGNVAYKFDYYGDVVAAPAPQYAPPQRQTRTEPKAVPQTTPRVKPRVHERSRVRVQVREQQAVAPFAILGFLAAAAIAIVLLLGYVQLNSVYAQTVTLQHQLTDLQDTGANLEARYEEVFDMDTLKQAVAEDGTLSTPNSNQSVYIDLSEPDNAVVYGAQDKHTGISGFFEAVGSLFSSAVEYFR